MIDRKEVFLEAIKNAFPFTRCVVCYGKVRPWTEDASQLRDGTWVDSGECWEYAAEIKYLMGLRRSQDADSG